MIYLTYFILGGLFIWYCFKLNQPSGKDIAEREEQRKRTIERETLAEAHFEQFGQYISKLFEKREQLTVTELEDRIKADFPKYKDGRPAGLINDLLLSDLLERSGSNYRKGDIFKMPLLMFPGFANFLESKKTYSRTDQSNSHKYLYLNYLKRHSTKEEGISCWAEKQGISSSLGTFSFGLVHSHCMDADVKVKCNIDNQDKFYLISQIYVIESGYSNGNKKVIKSACAWPIIKDMPYKMYDSIFSRMEKGTYFGTNPYKEYISELMNELL